MNFKKILFYHVSILFCRINTVFHTNPSVLHYKSNQRIGTMAPGHTFTIEPMLCLGRSESFTWPDKWTATTIDGLHSAQFEHTLLITESGVEILTGKLNDSPKFFWE
jgi:methionyl aminopeptidase